MTQVTLGANDADEYFQVMTPGVSQVKAFTGTSSQSAAVGATTNLVRLVSDQDCFVKFAANPTAIADGTSMFLPAKTPEYFGITGGQKIAVIQSSSGGNLYITEAA